MKNRRKTRNRTEKNIADEELKRVDRFIIYGETNSCYQKLSDLSSGDCYAQAPAYAYAKEEDGGNKEFLEIRLNFTN